MKLKHIVLLFSYIHINAYAIQPVDLLGDWCFYEQTASDNVVKEKVDLALDQDGTYSWKEGPFEQTGSWELSENSLKMVNIGTHKIIELKGNILTLQRFSIQKYKEGLCDTDSFSEMDITRFHNAASTGEIDVIYEYLNKGIDIDIVDFNKEESALIKAAKFCRIEIANLLLENGANKTLKNEKGKNALDLAKSSMFHKGCDELMSTIQ